MSISSIQPAPDAESVALVWQDVPEQEREKPAVAISAAKAFYHCMLPKKSEEILYRVLDKFWDDRLVNAFVEFAESREPDDLTVQAGHCERWLEKYGRQPQLLLALGVLASRQKQFDKSASCFEEAISLTSDRKLLYQLIFCWRNYMTGWDTKKKQSGITVRRRSAARFSKPDFPDVSLFSGLRNAVVSTVSVQPHCLV